jgi:hypothetical protein
MGRLGIGGTLGTFMGRLGNAHDRSVNTALGRLVGRLSTFKPPSRRRNISGPYIAHGLAASPPHRPPPTASPPHRPPPHRYTFVRLLRFCQVLRFCAARLQITTGDHSATSEILLHFWLRFCIPSSLPGKKHFHSFGAAWPSGFEISNLRSEIP